jgi:hypothetical protein
MHNAINEICISEKPKTLSCKIIIVTFKDIKKRISLEIAQQSGLFDRLRNKNVIKSNESTKRRGEYNLQYT